MERPQRRLAREREHEAEEQHVAAGLTTNSPLETASTIKQKSNVRLEDIAACGHHVEADHCGQHDQAAEQVVQQELLVVRFEQIGEVYDVPVTVTLNLGDKSVDEVVAVTDTTVEKRIPFAGSLRSIEVNGDNGALGVFERR